MEDLLLIYIFPHLILIFSQHDSVYRAKSLEIGWYCIKAPIPACMGCMLPFSTSVSLFSFVKGSKRLHCIVCVCVGGSYWMLYKGPGLEPHTWQGLNNFLTLPYPCPSPLSVPKLKPPWESKARITQIFFRESSKVTAFVQMIWKSCLNHSIFCSNFFFFW